MDREAREERKKANQFCFTLCESWFPKGVFITLAEKSFAFPPYNVVCGPIGGSDNTTTGNHLHGYIKYINNGTMLKSSAFRVLQRELAKLGCTQTEGIYFKALWKTAIAYSKYMKHQHESDAEDGSTPNRKEMNLQKICKMLKDRKKKVTYNAMFKLYCSEIGHVEATIAKPYIMTFCNMHNIQLDDEKLTKVLDVSDTDYFNMACTTYANTKRMLDCSKLTYKSPLLKGVPHTDLIEYLLSLPVIMRYCPRFAEDGLPMIYITGPTSTGKTTYLNHAQLRKMACDAEGVGKWELRNNEKGFFCDELKNSQIFLPTNEGKIKEMARGHETVIKVHGSTEVLPASWLCIANNDGPLALPSDRVTTDAEADKMNLNAMKCRFVTIEPKELDYDIAPVLVLRDNPIKEAVYGIFTLVAWLNGNSTLKDNLYLKYYMSMLAEFHGSEWLTVVKPFLSMENYIKADMAVVLAKCKAKPVETVKPIEIDFLSCSNADVELYKKLKEEEEKKESPTTDEEEPDVHEEFERIGRLTDSEDESSDSKRIKLSDE